MNKRSKVLGTVLGAAIGDAMGHPTEFLPLAAIRAQWPPSGVTKFEKFWERDGKRFAPYTDDTQMSEIVLRTLLDGRDQSLSLQATMELMGERFVEWKNNPQGGHRGPGNSCLGGCHALEEGKPWNEAGGLKAGGCGSVMRAYPFGLVFENLNRAELWAINHSRLTHRDPIALAACAAMARGIGNILNGETSLTVLADMTNAAERYSAETAGMINNAATEAIAGVEPEEVLTRLEGWTAHEAIAAATYIVMRHPGDYRAAVLEGANTPGDSDSIASIAGALVGARVGVEGIPDDWIRDVERSEELQALAERVLV
jgi:ADP-ribosylglycohydrolase